MSVPRPVKIVEQGSASSGQFADGAYIQVLLHGRDKGRYVDVCMLDFDLAANCLARKAALYELFKR